MSTVTEMAAARAQALASADEPMTIAEAIGKAQFLRLQPECVVSALEARRVIDALLSAIQSSPTFHKALLAGEEVFVLRSRDRAAPMAIHVWALQAAEHGADHNKVSDAEQTWVRWELQSPDKTRWPT